MVYCGRFLYTHSSYLEKVLEKAKRLSDNIHIKFVSQE